MALAKVTNQRERDKFKEVGSQTTVAIVVYDSSGSQINLAKEAGGNLADIKTNTDNIPSDPSTEAKQDDIIAELQLVDTPTVYNVTLTSADTEYSQALPANTREFRFRCRTLYDVRYAWVTGKVATPTSPYLTLPAGSDYYSDWNNLASQTLYLASSTAGVQIEIECWV